LQGKSTKYFAEASGMKKKSFSTLTPDGQGQRLFGMGRFQFSLLILNHLSTYRDLEQ
jgi:hypothetical protein